MKTTLKLLAALLLLSTLNHPRSTALAQGANFTYQGRLNASGSPANGLYDLTFALYNTNGTLASAVLNLNTVTVSNGLFTTALNFNSGNSSPFNGQDLLLEIAVRTNGGGTFSTLSPRQPLTPAPYAIYSATASGVTTGAVTSAGIAASTITAGNIAGGQVVKSLNGLKDVVALAAGANVTLTTNGNTLTLASSGGAGSSWLLAGNGGTTPGVNFLGTTDNLPLELKVNGTRAFRLEPTPAGGTPNVIGGAPYNYAAAAGIFIGGGGASGLSNSVGLVSDYAVISGGLNNSIGTNSAYTTIAGGHDNGISYNATDSTIGGGDYNNIQPYVSDSVIAGGDFNLLQTGAGFSAIGGGYKNTVAGGYSTIAGGYSNLVSQSYATVAGGDGNTAGSDHGTVGGGQLNVVNNHHSTIGGGRQNSVSAFNSTIGGGFSNFIRRDSDDSVVAGGNGNAIDSYDGTIAGGVSNWIQTNSYNSTIGGGNVNLIQSNAYNATIGGGKFNSILTGAHDAFIGGGFRNTNSGQYATVPGGINNVASGYASIALGGLSTASGSYSTSMGGGSTASGQGATAMGASANASGDFSVAMGYISTASGSTSFAAGSGAQAGHNNAFVWSDGSAFTASGAVNQFVARASAGFFFYSSADGLGAQLSPNATAWAPLSDRNAKENFKPLDTRNVLEKLVEMPLTQWNYKADPDQRRYIGPMAQDFHAAFGLGGNDDKHINTLDADGVTFAAIQGLNQKVEEKEAKIQELSADMKAQQAENVDLKSRLDRLEKLVTAKNGGGK